MNWFDALCHAMSACATSGFSTKNASVAYFDSPLIETVLILTMGIAGMHFGLIYATVTGKRNNLFRSEVTRWYVGILLGCSVLIAVSLYAADIYPTLTSSFRHAAFQFFFADDHDGFRLGRFERLAAVRRDPAHVRLDRLRLRRIDHRRHEGKPARAGRKDDPHATTASAASQRRDPHQARRHASRRTG